jgi:hypothetical protein
MARTQRNFVDQNDIYFKQFRSPKTRNEYLSCSSYYDELVEHGYEDYIRNRDRKRINVSFYPTNWDDKIKAALLEQESKQRSKLNRFN